MSAPEPAGTPNAPVTAAGERLKVAFVGQGVYFAQCILEQGGEQLEPSFIDYRAATAPGSMLAELARADPDVVLVFRPEIVPPGLFASLRAVTIGYLTEPLPRARGQAHADLQARMWWLEQVDPGNFDRIVSFDPLIAETAGNVIGVWRSLPIPVADSLFMDCRPTPAPPRLLFVGRSTEHRERLLEPVKARHEIVHVAHGLYGEHLRRMLAASDVQLNLHNNPYPTFENRVSIALAAGHLVISEPLSPAHGLVAGTDYLEVSEPAELAALLDRVAAEPASFDEVRRAGRGAAERFRASAVYAPLLRDAVEDVRAQGGRG